MAKLFRHPVGHQVALRNPTTGKESVGRILDEVWLQEPEEFTPIAPKNDGWREGAPVVQLIEFPSENNRRYVRFTYYVRQEGQDAESWRFGGQHALFLPVEDYRMLLTKLQVKAW